MFPPLLGTPVRTVLRGDGPNGQCLWVGTGGKGLLRFDLRSDGERAESAFKLTKEAGLPNNYISNLEQWGGAQGRGLWIGTGRGLVRFDGQRLVRYTPTSGFPGSVTSILPGRGAERGLLFVGLNPGGLAILREDGSWGLVGQTQGLPDSAVRGLAYTEQGSSRPLLWVGTGAGGIARADPGRWQLLDERRDVPTRGMAGLGIPDLPADTVVADLATTADGSLWVAGQHSLWRLHASERTEFTVDNSQLPAVFADLLTAQAGASGDDTLWVGTGHGLARWDKTDGLRKVLDHPLPQSGKSIRALTLAALGNAAKTIWVGSDDGLLQRQGDRWKPMAIDCLHGAAIRILAAHTGPHGGEVWVGTDGPLLRLRAGGCERRDDLFPGGYVEQITFDHDGCAYVFGTGGAPTP